MPARKLLFGGIVLVGVMVIALFGLVALLAQRDGATVAPGGEPALAATPAAVLSRIPTATSERGSAPATGAAAASATATATVPVGGPAATRTASAPPPTAVGGNPAGATDTPVARQTVGASTRQAMATAPAGTTAAASPTPTVSATPQPSASAAPGPAQATATATRATATRRPAATATARPTALPAATATAETPGIEGRVLRDGQPAEPGLVLLLEDTELNLIAESTVGSGGTYRFENVPATTGGYNVTFSWERNPGYDLNEVVAWGWIGQVSYAAQDALRLPDLEIGLAGLATVAPEPDSGEPLAAISAATPLTFAWGEHPAAARYWVDLLADDSFERVWHSPLSPATTAAFGGQLDDGTRVQAGNYWWAVGGQRFEEGYHVTVYGHLAGLTLTP